MRAHNKSRETGCRALRGDLDEVEYYRDPVFGFQVPEQCPGVPDSVLHPARSWPGEEAYMRRYRQLAARFIGNFEQFADEAPAHLREAGPRL